MSKPVLPSCSARDCKSAAGAIINGTLLCTQHAVEKMERLRLLRNGNGAETSPTSRNGDEPKLFDVGGPPNLKRRRP